MQTLVGTGIVAGLIALVASLNLFVQTLGPQQSLGSIETGSEYLSTVITSADVGTTSVKSVFGAVGSVVVTDVSTDVGTLKFFDTASSTIATTSLTAFIEVDTAAVENTYTFDVSANSGIYLEVPTGFDGNLTVTYR
jgi:hypothetical protein